MKKSRIIAIMLCVVMLFAIVACNKNNDTPANNSSPAGGDSSPAGGDSSPAGGGSSPAGGGSSPAGGGSTPAGGGSSPAGGGGAPGRDTLIVAMTQDGGTLDPLYNVGWDFLNSLRMVYEPLWEFQAGRVMRYVLATELEELEPTRWIIHLRDDVFFSNGNKFTADDVLFSLWRANNRPGVGAYIPELNTDLSRAIDDYTVEIIYNNPSITHLVTFASIYMFDKESFDDDTVAMIAMGTGPYIVDDYVVNSHFNLVARSDYWGPAPNIPKLQFVHLAEEAQRVNALQIGEVDIAAVPFQDIRYVQALDNVNVDLIIGTTTAMVHMGPTTSRNCFSELGTDARRAIALAIDRQAIKDIVYDGFAEISRYSLSAGTTDVPESLFDQGIYGEPNNAYNPELARELAISSGLVNYTPVLINNGSAAHALIAELIQLNLAAIGVNIEVQTLDPGSWLTVAFDESQWDMAVSFTFGDTAASAFRTYIQRWYTSPAWPGSERAQELVSDIMLVTDEAELQRRYVELSDITCNSIPWFQLVDVLVPTAYNKDLKGWTPMLSGNVIYTDLSW